MRGTGMATAHPNGPLAGRHLVLGLTGGIACYKVAELARLLIKAGATVQVAMTEAATRFITPLTMQALTGHPVFLDEWTSQDGHGMAHIDLSRRADGIVVAPASADFMARLAHGMANDLLSTLCLARDCPLAIVPAMNRQMWSNPATQRNAHQLRHDGIAIWGPDAGDQACGEVGDGRMLEADAIRDAIVAWFTPKRLQGHRVVITAGPTFEPIDPVRGITNRSSGKMGYAIARAAADAGADVTLISGPTALPMPWGVRRLDVETAQQMRAAVHAVLLSQDNEEHPALTHTPDTNAGPSDIDRRGLDQSNVGRRPIFIAVAAVADWRPAAAATEKIKRSNDPAPTLAFVENPDILREVAHGPNPPYCVGFAAETNDLDTHATEKRARKRVPLLVGNLGHLTFGKDDNEIVLFDDEGRHPLPPGDKASLARRLIEEIARRVTRSHSPSVPQP
ncbi:phosphopantothenoylcysteine decarboxylase/phosphopantothenate--cysteine ligase [Robbsia andropogonis]|uniref:bifunctional phosphopantothenoylcysteine decarboxylase/phosphopantothenate--cysteine ligase CoaBC n=1 Tax=Robbsia andropogonis TaxID=28092 RepID=UPI002A6A6D9B|nr:bifunctional phosphopantothenoylcysteine decarboxylase/phosphopantothenate--cysteine ligase CoaBC [Robbsia andropogonis]